eukprot:1456529-Alexandrium_andersonii.AAC.1
MASKGIEFGLHGGLGIRNHAAGRKAFISLPPTAVEPSKELKPRNALTRAGLLPLDSHEEPSQLSENSPADTASDRRSKTPKVSLTLCG